MPESHPDDETLNAVLDGEADPDAIAHAEACASCRARLAELGAVAAAVASISSIPPSTRDAVIAQALQTAGGERVAAPRPRRTRWTWTAPRFTGLAAAAAVLVAVVVAVTLLVAGDDGEDQVALRDEAFVAVDNLGSVSDDNSLRATLEPRLGPRAATGGAALAAPAAPPGAEEGTSDAAGTGAESAAPAEEPAPQTARAAGDDDATQAQVRACEAQLRQRLGRTPELVYVARLQWRDEAALVLAFRSASPAQTTAYVMARADCRILVFQRFSA